MTGDLTIKGVTRSVTFDLEFDGVQADPWGNTKAGFTATTAINRSDWGLTWNAAIEGGGVLVSDKITITLEVELLKG
jgi:polyisoprenoid-binding protein YceI